MSNYTKTTNFAAKDSLPSGNAAKIVKGAEIDTEFNNIATASATKANANNAALTGTTVFATLSDGTIAITGWVDEDNMASNSAVLIPTQQSVKAYVDSNVTAQDLDVTDGTTSIDIDLDSESLGILGGTGITSTASGTGVTLAIDSTVTTLTGTQTLTNKTLTSPTLTTPTITTSFTIGSATITEAELEILDGATVTTAELNVLDGITSTTAELNILDGVTSTAAELNILDGVTSTAAEINILDGVTSTTAELNILDGVTSTAAELNILDGVTSTATELNILDGVTATTAEINYVDGVTSNVQTQLNTKAPIAGATFTGTTTIPTADINGGAIDGTVIGGSTAAAGSFTTLGASGAITGTLGTAAQTNITSVGTLGALTVTGDVTVDTNTLKVDSTNNRVGILNASPDVTLDVGSSTDAIHLPTGTTAQRPTADAGYFRYNSQLAQFEGYSTEWLVIGSTTGTTPADGSVTSAKLSGALTTPAALTVTGAFTSLGIDDNSNATAITIDASENVGIGETSPLGKLHIKGSDTGATASAQGNSLVLEDLENGLSILSSSSGAGYINFGDSGDNNIGMIVYDHSANVLSTHVNGSERMRITSAGDMYFGQTSGSAADAGHIMQANGVMFHTKDSGTVQYLRRLGSDGDIIQFNRDGTTVGAIGVDSVDLFVSFSQTNNIGIKSGVTGGTAVLFPCGNTGSVRDNAASWGYANGRWKEIFAVNGSINTSDRNEKQDIEALTDAEQRVAVACKGLLRKFRWIDAVAEKGDDARIHFGIIAQDLQAAFEAEGLDAARYAMFTSNTWTDEDTGEERTRLGVRYSELLAFIISAI